ncbi:hypothetical protein TNCV_3309451 [Trichonephila clavipes]|nr:hypothetical protein TNCV_3309451 [Trichonephila clavipes]
MLLPGEKLLRCVVQEAQMRTITFLTLIKVELSGRIVRKVERGTLHFWCVTTCGSTLYSSPSKPTFQQDNARPHVAGIVRTFLDT